jgi:hypothetical protein
MAVVINGGLDQIGQMGAAMCIQKLLEYLIASKHEALLEFVVPKLVQLFYVRRGKFLIYLENQMRELRVHSVHVRRGQPFRAQVCHAQHLGCRPKVPKDLG